MSPPHRQPKRPSPCSRPAPRWESLTAARTTRGVRTAIEVLERRRMFSTLTVLNTLDGGAGSLRAQVAAAHSGDTVVFAPSLAGQTITLTKGELLISRNLTIAGPGAGQLTVSGNH